MRQIPALGNIPAETKGPLEAIKENLEELRGTRGGKISKLSGTATLPECIAKINELITRMQG